MTEKPLQVILPIGTFDTPTTPSNLYSYSLDDIINFCYINDAKKIYSSEKFGVIEIQIVPIIEIAIDEIQKAYRKERMADFYSTLGTFGHSITQHRFNLDYKTMRTARTQKFNDGKLQEIVGVYKWKKHLFEKEEGGRGRVKFYADINNVIAATHEYKQYFRTSASDMIQVYLCEVILKYEALHNDNKFFFENTLKEFDKRVKDIQSDIGTI